MRKRNLIFFIILIVLTSPIMAQELTSESHICTENQPYWDEWAQDAEERLDTSSVWNVTGITVNPNGKNLAVANRTTLALYDAETLELQQTLETDMTWTIYTKVSLSWSPDGEYLAVARYMDRTETPDPKSGIYVWDINQGQVLEILPIETETIDWSPDGQLVAAANFSRVLSLWETESWQTIKTYNPYDADGVGTVIDQIAWSSTEPLLAAIDESGGPLFLWHVEDEDKPRILPTDFAGYMAWSPDGATLILASWAHSLMEIWDVETKQVIGTLDGSDGNPFEIAWSPDGRYLARGTQSGLYLWDMTKEDRPMIRFDEHVPPFRRIAWATDSKSLFSVDYRGTNIYHWDIETGCVIGRIENAA